MPNATRLVLLDIWYQKGSVSALAEAVHITQPAASHQLKLLEEEWGGGIFFRNGKRLTLTEKGRRLLEGAQEIQKTLNFLEMDIFGKTPVPCPGLIKIGVSNQIERPFIVNLLGKFFDHFEPSQRPSVQLLSLPSDELSKKFHAEELDLLVTDALEEDSDTISRISLPVHLVISRRLGLPLTKLKSLEAEAVLRWVGDSKIGMVLPGRSIRLRREVEGFLDLYEIPRKVVFESDILATIVRAVSDGIGIGVLPSAYFTDDLKSGKVEIFGPEEGLWPTHIYFLARKNSVRSDLRQFLVETLKTV